MSKDNEPAKCGAPTKNNGPCGWYADSCPHESHAKYRDESNESETMSDSNNTPAIIDPELIQENTDALAKFGGVKSAYDGKTLATTVAIRMISRNTSDRTEKAAQYAAMFGECSHPECDDGCNGFESDTCKDHEGYTQQDESDESDSEQKTVVIDGKEVTGDMDTIKALLDQ